jgi:hypothetical protein
VWELCDQALEEQRQNRNRSTRVTLPGADLDRVLVTDREQLYRVGKVVAEGQLGEYTRDVTGKG